VVLPLPVGRSLYARLRQLADAEGLDLATLAVQLLAYQAGMSATRSTRAATPQRPDLAARFAIVCIMCGRERCNPREVACGHCGGKWVKTSA
jgi:hypothetical protein